MTKLRLKSLIFSADEYPAVCKWAQMHSEQVDVELPSGISGVPFTRAIYPLDILNSSIDGILICDHRRFSKSDIDLVVYILGTHNKRLYAVSQSLTPLEPEQENNIGMTLLAESAMSQYSPPSAVYVDSGIVKALEECAPALCWLDREEPISVDKVPSKYRGQIKRLEQLGLVSRRNGKTLELKLQRLRRILEHESKVLSVNYTLGHFLKAPKETKEVFYENTYCCRG